MISRSWRTGVGSGEEVLDAGQIHGDMLNIAVELLQPGGFGMQNPMIPEQAKKLMRPILDESLQESGPRSGKHKGRGESVSLVQHAQGMYLITGGTPMEKCAPQCDVVALPRLEVAGSAHDNRGS